MRCACLVIRYSVSESQVISSDLQMKMLRVREVKQDLPAKNKTSSEGDLCAGSFDLGVKM